MSSQKLKIDEEFLKKAFEELDTNGDGFLSNEEITKFIASSGIKVLEEDIKTLILKLNNTERGEFIGKCLYQVRALTIYYNFNIV